MESIIIPIQGWQISITLIVIVAAVEAVRHSWRYLFGKDNKEEK